MILVSFIYSVCPVCNRQTHGRTDGRTGRARNAAAYRTSVERTVTSLDDVVAVFNWHTISTFRQTPAVTVEVDRAEAALEAETARPQLLGQVGRRRRRWGTCRKLLPPAALQ